MTVSVILLANLLVALAMIGPRSVGANDGPVEMPRSGTTSGVYSE